MRLLNMCRATVAWVVLCALSVSACGDSPSGPTSGTRVEAVIQDSPAQTATVTGTVAGNISASLWNGSRWIEVGSPNGITFPLQIAGRTTTIHGEASVASGSYSRVRLVFQGVSARVAMGSVVGGTTVTSETTIILGGSDERVEIDVPVSTFSVEADANVRRLIVFDLRSQQWLTVAAVQSRRVEDAALQAVVTASTRLENR